MTDHQSLKPARSPWWRERGEDLPIFIVFSGSEVGFFEREVVSYSATTFRLVTPDDLFG